MNLIKLVFNMIWHTINLKYNKIWVDQRNEFYKNHFKKWLKDNDISMY